MVVCFFNYCLFELLKRVYFFGVVGFPRYECEVLSFTAVRPDPTAPYGMYTNPPASSLKSRAQGGGVATGEELAALAGAHRWLWSAYRSLQRLQGFNNTVNIPLCFFCVLKQISFQPHAPQVLNRVPFAKAHETARIHACFNRFNALNTLLCVSAAG